MVLVLFAVLISLFAVAQLSPAPGRFEETSAEEVVREEIPQVSAQDQSLCQQVIDAPAKDKNLVGGVLSALENPNKLDAVLDIFTALNNWLKP